MKKIGLMVLGALISSSFLTTSCYRHNEDPGPIKTESRPLPKFSKLQVEGSMDVYLTSDSSDEIIIEAGTYLLPYIKTNLRGETLVISEKRNRFDNDDVDVYVPCSSLSGLELSGSGSVSGSELYSDKIKLELSGSGDIVLTLNTEDISTKIKGSGDIILEGKTKFQDIYISGSGNVDARFFKTEFTNVKIKGSGDANVEVSEDLDVEISGSGDVKYWGNPKNVYQEIDGSGRVIKM